MSMNLTKLAKKLVHDSRNKNKNTDSSAGFHQNQLESICVFSYWLVFAQPLFVWLGLVAYLNEGGAVDVCVVVPASDGPKIIQTDPTIMASIVGIPNEGLTIAITL